MAPESDPSRGLDRRSFVAGVATLLAWPAQAWSAQHEKPPFQLPELTLEGLESSAYVYVSPLRSDGSESTCHGEVWFGWIDGAVVLNTSADSWKARALDRGLDHARLWVGDLGRWKTAGLLESERFRKAPHFDARARRETDPKLLDRLLGIYDLKYPEEFGKWRDKMRGGVASGERLMIRYEPIGSSDDRSS